MSERKNPFEKLDGGKGADAGGVPAGDPSAPVCPFLGVLPTPVINKSRIVGNPLEAMQVAGMPMACQREQCAMWHAERATCSIRVGIDAIVDLKTALAKSPFLGG